MFPATYAGLVEAPLVLGRVAAHDRGSYLVIVAHGMLRASVTGAARHRAAAAHDLPLVGDYVALRCADASADAATVVALLPRFNTFVRRAAGDASGVQAIAANIDRVFVAVALDRDFNLRRIERYLVAAAACGVPIGLLFTKADLVDDVAPYRVAAEAIARGAPVVFACAHSGDGLAELAPFRGPQQTIALVGSSGVGKSTLVNALAGTLQAVGGLRDDGRGRHTTTRRELLILPDGTSIIDTPGMREFAPAGASIDTVDATFDDIATVAAACRFNDCAHEHEPGCAVREAVDPARLEGWRKLRRETAYEERKANPAAARAEKLRWKAIHVANRRRYRER